MIFYPLLSFFYTWISASPRDAIFCHVSNICNFFPIWRWKAQVTPGIWCHGRPELKLFENRAPRGYLSPSPLFLSGVTVYSSTLHEIPSPLLFSHWGWETRRVRYLPFFFFCCVLFSCSLFMLPAKQRTLFESRGTMHWQRHTNSLYSL